MPRTAIRFARECKTSDTNRDSRLPTPAMSRACVASCECHLRFINVDFLLDPPNGREPTSMITRLTIAIVAVVASVLSTSAFGAVGRTAGSFDVSPRGSAQYTIPIWTPPGIRGVQPHLALVYDSHSSYGIMGPGWNLSGLSSIT